MNKPYLVFYGAVDTYSGYGSRARDLVKSLIDIDQYDVEILSCRWGDTPKGFLQEDNLEHKKILDRIIDKLTKQPDIFIMNTVPNEFQAIGKYYSIGVTAGIETTLCDISWIEGCNKMDLVLTSSEHSKNTFINSVYKQNDANGNLIKETKLIKPCEVLFEGVDLNVYFKSDFKETELYSNINNVIKEDFAFLVLGHWLPGDFGQDRKNIGYTIKAFLEVFKHKKNKPALILKTSHGVSSIIDRDAILKKIEDIKSTCHGAENLNIYLLHGDLSDEDINILYNHPKVKSMVSLTKGEGFGRPLLEFSVIGKPIIASGWSGQIDFLSPEFTGLVGGTLENVHSSVSMPNMLLKEAKWFKPDDNQVGYAFNDVYENYKEYLEKAKRLAFRNKKQFSLEQMTVKLKEILDLHLPLIPLNKEIVLPKLKKINE